MSAIPEVKIIVKTRGMWKLALLTFFLRHRSMRHTVHVHLMAKEKPVCVVNPTTLTGQPSTNG